MAEFLEALADSGSVSAAARSVGMTRASAYRLRIRLQGHPFDLAWEAALGFAMQQLAHEALDRCLNGVPVPIYYQGEQVGERRQYPENLTRFLLANPGRIGNAKIRDAAVPEWMRLVRRFIRGPIVWTEEEIADAERKAKRLEKLEGAQPVDYRVKANRRAAGMGW